MSNFEVIDAGNGRIVKAWKHGVQFEDKAVQQLKDIAQLPFIHKYVAAMPDCHWGIGASVGTVIATKGAVIPAAVGVDIGCGMEAIKTNRKRGDIDDVVKMRRAIEDAVPHGRSNNGGTGDIGAWQMVPENVQQMWDARYLVDYNEFSKRHPGARAHNTVAHLGTLGTGNHFIELCTDEEENVWILLHSGSRGLGNKIGTYFIKLAQELCERWFVKLPNADLAYLPKGTQEFDDYNHAVRMAQDFAQDNRSLMTRHVLLAMELALGREVLLVEHIGCHHNYIAWENHFGENVMVTRKGAVRAREGDLGIIPGSMGARTYIVKGLGNKDSFETCSHGAGRSMGRREAERRFSVEQHAAATAGVECDKTASTLDETPLAYKDIDAVMAAQSDLVEPVHHLKQFICVKGGKD